METRRLPSVAFIVGGLLSAACRSPVPAPAPSAPPVQPPAVRLVVTGPESLKQFGVMVGSPAVPLHARLRHASGAEETPARITYVSRAPGVVAVDSSGAVTGVTPGEAYVVASLQYGGQTLADSVQVRPECTAELRVRTTPGDTIIRVGETFMPAVQMFSCGGHVQLSDTFTWRSRDPGMVQVDAATGRAVGLAPGETSIEVTGRTYGTFEVTRVRVRSRGA